MAYLSFISDTHFLSCIEQLYDTYSQCKQTMDLNSFYKNKIDPIKFSFDMMFNDIDIESYIVNEITRKNDKTINNAIGIFHQNLFDGIDGFKAPMASGYDIKKLDNTIFCELKNKHNTMNSASQKATFHKLASLSEQYPNATCYLVEIIATRSQDILWEFKSGNEYCSHPKVRRISADKFYSIATGNPNAFKELCEAIPVATNDFLVSKGITPQQASTNNRVYQELTRKSEFINTDILSMLFKDTFYGFNGF